MVMCAVQWFLPCQSYYSLFLFHHPLQVFLTKWFDGGAFMNYAKEPESSVLIYQYQCPEMISFYENNFREQLGSITMSSYETSVGQEAWDSGALVCEE